MKRSYASLFRLLLLVQLTLLALSPAGVYASVSLIELEPAARWEFATAWRGRASERDFTSLAALAEGREVVQWWSWLYQLTYRPNFSTDLSLFAVRSGTSARVEMLLLAPALERHVETLRDAGWRSIGFSAARRWTSSSGTSWRMGLDFFLCDFSGPCTPRLSRGQVSLGRASDPVVWRAALSLERSSATLSGGVDIVISPSLALGAALLVNRHHDPGELTAWWDQTLTIHLGRERYISIGLELDLSRYEPTLSVGIDLPLEGG